MERALHVLGISDRQFARVVLPRILSSARDERLVSVLGFSTTSWIVAAPKCFSNIVCEMDCCTHRPTEATVQWSATGVDTLGYRRTF